VSFAVISLAISACSVNPMCSRALGVHPNPKAAAGSAAVSSTRAPALQVWQILDQASSAGPDDQAATLALCLEMAQKAISETHMNLIVS